MQTHLLTHVRETHKRRIRDDMYVFIQYIFTKLAVMAELYQLSYLTAHLSHIASLGLMAKKNIMPESCPYFSVSPEASKEAVRKEEQLPCCC